MPKTIIYILISIILVVPHCSKKTQKKALVGTAAVLDVIEAGLSPMQLTAMILKGIATLPYFTTTDLREINNALIKNGAKITLADTYRWAYQSEFENTISKDGDTGVTFTRVRHATIYFQKILREYGFKSYDKYYITANNSASDQGYVLFAIVRRPWKSIRITMRNSSKGFKKLTAADDSFYTPFKKDYRNKRVDTIIDYGGIPSENYTKQKMQAILLTLAANSVVNKQKRPGYWKIEQQWIEGDYEKIMNNNNREIINLLGLNK